MTPIRVPARILIAGTFLLACIACESSPPAAERGPQPGPIDVQPGVEPPAREPAPRRPRPVASQPAPTTRPRATTQPARPAPELPEYLQVLNRFDPHKPFDLHARTEGTNTLVIDTQNVQRIRIDRQRLPLTPGRLILRIDNQGIEWGARSETTEFARTDTGAWEPVPVKH